MIDDRAAAIFLEAQSCEEEHRQEFVRRACGDDSELAAAVTRLLDAADESEDYFSALSAKVGLEALVDDDRPLPENKLIGQWRLKRRLGRGGMGSVYLAERADEHYEQRAALKILPAGLDTEQSRARFLVERQILARLVHDNIARLLDGGVTDDGLPYFVMDYVEGRPIDEYCDAQALTSRQRLALVLDVARAVQFAHRNLVIHRDLKPSNVLVADDAQVRLLDFGIAKMLEPDSMAPDLTRMTHRPATPTFASPEMLRGEPVDVTTDVYSLGALAYTLLTGRTPLDFDGLGLTEMCKRASTVSPPAASSVNDRLDAEIDAILDKALAKDPSDRYASVEALASDLKNYIEGRPIDATPPSGLYRARKFLRRNRLAVGIAVFLAVDLALFAILAIRSAVVAERQAQEIMIERDRANETRDFLVSILEQADPNRSGGTLTARNILDKARARIDDQLAERPLLQADLLEAMGGVYESWRLLDEGRATLEREGELRRQVNGAESAEYADLLVRLAVITDLAGDHGASLVHAEQALAISTTLELPDTRAAALVRIGRVAESQRDFDEALRRYGEAVEILQRHTPDSSNLAFGVANVGHALMLQDRFDEAAPQYRRALKLLDERLPQHWFGGEVRWRLGQCLLADGQFAEAEALILEGLETVRAQWGDDDARTRAAAAAAAELYESRGQPDLAETFRSGT